MSPISLVFLLFAQTSICNQWLPMAVPTTSGLCLMWTLRSTGLLPCPLPSSPGLRSSCLWATWSLSPWGSDPSTPTLSPAIFSLRVLGCIFTERRKQKGRKTLFSNQVFLTPSWKYVTLCYSVPEKYCYVITIPLNSSIKEFCSHFLSVGLKTSEGGEITLISMNE